MTSFTREKRFKTRSASGTLALASTIAEIFAPPRVVLLRGPLGAGKTALVKGWAAALHAAREDDVTSPTFTLVHQYTGPSVTIYHLDLYRLESERELLTLGVDEMAAAPDGLVLIEWGEKFPSLVELADAEIAITPLEADERSFLVRWND